MLLRVGEEVSIALPHRIRSMSNPRIDDSLVDALHGAVTAEGMSEAVPAPYLIPSTVAERSLEMVIRFISRDRLRFFANFSAPSDLLLTERELAARMLREPILHDVTKRG